MTALNFPDSPSNGDTYQGYTYDSTKGTWTKPAGPENARTSVYANIAALPTSGTAGDMAYVTATNRLYLWTGTGWYNIALINNNPTISGVNATYNLAIDGTATVITITATDPEGLPITYSIASDTSGNTATVTQGTGANTNVFTITPSTNDAHAGTFSLTFRASDGVNIASAAASFTLEFKVTNSQYTTALITSVGANNAVNNSFDDKSTNDHTITANGDVHQTTFSPYRPGGYAEHFTNDRISYANHSSLQIGTQDFCMEAWIKLRTQGVNYERYITHQASWAQGGVKGVEFASQTTGNLKLHLMIDGSSATDFGYEHSIVKERWYHAVITRESGHARIFIDGVMKNNAANTTNINGSGGTHFGTNTAGTDQMDDFFIRDFRLCIGGVPTDYSTTSTTNDATIFSVPNAHITKTSQGATASEVKALLFNTPYVQDNSDNTNASLTYHSKGQTIPDSPYDTLKYTSADHGGSAHLDGTGDYLGVGGSSNNESLSGDFCIEAWIYPTGTNDGTILGNYLSGPNRGWSMRSYTSNNLYLYFQIDGGSQIVYQTASNTVNPNSWNHVVWCRSGTDTSVFVNGSRKDNRTLSGTSAGAGGVAVGSLSQGFVGYHFTGSISDARVVNGSAVYDPSQTTLTVPAAPLTAITNTKLLVQSTDAGIIDKAQVSREAKLVGNTKSSTDQYKYLTSSMYFDGTGDYVQLNNIQLPADFTIELWARLNVVTTSSNIPFVVLGNSSSTGNWQFDINASNNLRLQYNTSGDLSASTGLTANTWHHLAVVRSGTTVKIYKDGTEVASGTISQNFNATEPVYIGRNRGNSTFLNGYVSDVRITAGLARYTANFTPPTAELKG